MAKTKKRKRDSGKGYYFQVELVTDGMVDAKTGESADHPDYERSLYEVRFRYPRPLGCKSDCIALMHKLDRVAAPVMRKWFPPEKKAA